MAYCSKCGKLLEDNVGFCSHCGQKVETGAVQQPQPAGYQQPQPAGYQQPQYAGYPQPANLLQQLSSKIKTEAVIWIVVASLQVLIGLLNVGIGLALNADYEDGTTNITSGVFLLIVAVINFVTSSRDFKYSRTILVQPTGIVTKYSPIGAYIVNLIYNLIFGGIIGVIGSIYGFVVRSFVVSNEAHFKNIESQYMNK